jgi:hypothetical protein
MTLLLSLQLVVMLLQCGYSNLDHSPAQTVFHEDF